MNTYLDKHILVILSIGASQAPDAKHTARPLKISGILRGFDMYNNLVLENAVDESHPGTKAELGEIVRPLFQCPDKRARTALYRISYFLSQMVSAHAFFLLWLYGR